MQKAAKCERERMVYMTKRYKRQQKMHTDENPNFIIAGERCAE